MLIPLAILALLSLAGGFLFKVPQFLAPLFPALEAPEDPALVAVSVAAGVMGIALAWLMSQAPLDFLFNRPIHAHLSPQSHHPAVRSATACGIAGKKCPYRLLGLLP